jgi:hypothetical protein
MALYTGAEQRPLPRLVGGTYKYALGRAGRRITAVVIHRMLGSLEGTDSYFRREFTDYYPYARMNASTHFGVGLWGTTPKIVQWVDTYNSAWGWNARPNDTPTPLAYKVLAPDIFNGSTDLNWQVISIEVEGFYDEFWHPETARKVKELLGWIYRTHGNLWVMGHTDTSLKACPGMYTFKMALPYHYGNQLGNIYGGLTKPAPTLPAGPMEGWPVKFKEVRKYGRMPEGTPIRMSPSGTGKIHWRTDRPIRRYMIGKTIGTTHDGSRGWYVFWAPETETDATFDGDLVYVHESKVTLE